MTNLPEMADRATVVELDVSLPTRSVVVVLGFPAAVDALTNLPLEVLLLTVRVMTHTPFWPNTWGHMEHIRHHCPRVGALPTK